MRDTKQLKQVWLGEYGRNYLVTNDFDYTEFIPYWEMVLEKTGDVKNVVEVGCNIGINLRAINDINQNIGLIGVEPFDEAAQIAKDRLPSANIIIADGFELPLQDGECEMSASLGVMMHIATEDLKSFISELCRVSSKYVLICEHDGIILRSPSGVGSVRVGMGDGFCYTKTNEDGLDWVFVRNYKNLVAKHLGSEPIADGDWWDADTHWYLFKK